MEETKRILQAQIAEAQERKLQEKKQDRLVDEQEERRVRSQLANMDIDERRNKELSKRSLQHHPLTMHHITLGSTWITYRSDMSYI